MRIGCVIGILLALVTASPAHARGLEVEDLLRLQEYTQIVLDPATRTTVVGRTRPYKDATAYRFDWFNRRMLSELWIRDTRGHGPLQRFLGSRGDTGYWASSLAPGGRRLVVFRLAADRLSVGIADLLRRRVRWLPGSPDLPYIDPNPTWLGADRLLVVERADGSLPHQLAFGFAPARTDPVRWQTTSAGRVAGASALGSGRFLGIRPPTVPRRLVIHDLRSGARRIVASGEMVDLAVAPDHRRAAILFAGADLPMRPDRVVDPADLTRAHRLDIVDLRTGAATSACSSCDVLPNLLAWSPSGRQVMFFARNPGAAWEDGRLSFAGGRAGLPEITPVIDRSMPGVVSVHAQWMGETPILWGTRREGGEARPDWMAGSGPLTGGRATRATDLLAVQGDGYVFLAEGGVWHGRSGATARRINVTGSVAAAMVASDPLLAGTRALLNPPRDGVAIVTIGKDMRQPVVIGADGRLKRTFEPLGKGQRLFAALIEGGEAVILDRPTLRGSRLLWSQPGRKPVVIDRINTHLDGLRAYPGNVVSERRDDGSVRYHRLYLPDGAAKPLPLVVIPYPGLIWDDRVPSVDLGDADLTTNVQLLVSQGYAVLQPSLPAPQADMLDAIASDIADAIASAADTGRINRNRVAVLGHSYGGYAALAMATHGDIIRTVIAAAAPINLAGAYGFIDPRAKEQADGISTTIAFGWFEGGQGRIGVPPWRQPGSYIEASPFFRAGHFDVPVLLLHGEFDYLPVGGAEQLFMALYRQNKDAELVRYAAEGHVLRSPANVRDLWRRIFAWLDRMSPLHPSDASRRDDVGTGRSDTRPDRAQQVR